MVNLKYVLFIIVVFSFKLCNSQIAIIDTLVDIKSFPSIHNLFLNCENHKDSNFTGVQLFYEEFMNNKIRVEIEYKKGLKKKATGYYDNGQKYREVSYSNNKFNGLSTQWYKNGQIRYLSYYNNGISNFLINFYENGTIKMLDFDYSCKCDSSAKLDWSADGNLKEESKFLDTSKIGFITSYYYDTGELMTKYTANMGIQPYVSYYKNGKKGREGFIYNLTLCQNGQWQEWYKNGIRKREYYFDENIPNVKVGTWSWWDEEGNLIKQEVYENNKLIDKKEFLQMKLNKD
ncbi:MAG: hypothetical protein DRJ01_13015 [Bacteroidetes bacterium]|nr:MAG: hypothetical protein DRJ01_13015 [Bacteroidota bacterium]